MSQVLHPPAGGETVTGRPLVNLSLAVNYALGGLSLPGYHGFNLAVHLLAGLILFGIVRRTVNRNSVAFLVALLWIVHPLQTEAVTYLSQRAESLMGLCCLLTLYGFVRWSGPWAALSVVFCACGMAAKETMVVTPLLVLLYDRTFRAGTFRGALRARGGYYAALGATWIVLVYCLALSGQRGGTAGFGTAVTPEHYALFQATAILHYLRLCVWPYPLIFDYGVSLAAPTWKIALSCAALAILLAATGWALVRRPAWGFLGAWFFLLLAPSSSIVPVATQVMAEHRMYLPLAAVLAALICAAALKISPTPGLALQSNRLESSRSGSLRGFRAWVPISLFAAALLLALTVARNADYRTAISLWERTVADRPNNPRAREQLAVALSQNPALLPEAAAQDEAALRIDPNDAVAHNNLGNVYLRLPGRLPDAAAQFRAALGLNPQSALYCNNLAAVLARLPGQASAAAAEYERAIQLDPSYAPSHNGLGNLLAARPERVADAIAQFETALRLDPTLAEARNNLALLYAQTGRLPDAIRELERVVRDNPSMEGARQNLKILRAAAP